MNTVPVPVQLPAAQYRQLAIVAEHRHMQVHVLIEQMVTHALNPARRRPVPRPRAVPTQPIAVEGNEQAPVDPRRPGRPKLPVTDAELAQIRDGNALGRSDAVIAAELGWSPWRTTHYRKQVLGLPGVGVRTPNTHQKESNAA